LEVLKWVRTQGCSLNEGFCSTAAECGNLEALQWARSNGCPWDEAKCMEKAADNNQLYVLQWLVSNAAL
jgi:hypothetical protein